MIKFFKKNNSNLLPKDSYAYIKYVKPVIEREKQIKSAKRNSWFKDHSLELIFGIIGIILAIIAILLQ